MGVQIENVDGVPESLFGNGSSLRLPSQTPTILINNAKIDARRKAGRACNITAAILIAILNPILHHRLDIN